MMFQIAHQRENFCARCSSLTCSKSLKLFIVAGITTFVTLIYFIFKQTKSTDMESLDFLHDSIVRLWNIENALNIQVISKRKKLGNVSG